jgi:hypothetical protein
MHRRSVGTPKAAPGSLPILCLALSPGSTSCPRTTRRWCFAWRLSHKSGTAPRRCRIFQPRRDVACVADVDMAPRRWGPGRVRDRVGVLSNAADLCDSLRRERDVAVMTAAAAAGHDCRGPWRRAAPCGIRVRRLERARRARGGGWRAPFRRRRDASGLAPSRSPAAAARRPPRRLIRARPAGFRASARSRWDA